MDLIFSVSSTSFDEQTYQWDELFLVQGYVRKMLHNKMSIFRLTPIEKEASEPQSSQPHHDLHEAASPFP